jgi:hypothetical protein
VSGLHGIIKLNARRTDSGERPRAVYTERLMKNDAASNCTWWMNGAFALLVAGCSSSSTASLNPSDVDANAPDGSVRSADAAIVDGSKADSTIADSSANASDAAPIDASIADSNMPQGDASTNFTNAIFVAAGYDARRMTSTDGKTWPNNTYTAPGANDNIFASAVVGGGTIIIVGDPGVFTSTDGVTFTQRTPPAAIHHSVAGVYANNQFVFVDAANSFTTPDGITWKMATNSAQNAGHWHGVVFGNGKYLAIGDGGARKLSVDGLTWTDFAVDPTIAFASLGYGNGIYVGVGASTVDGGTVAHSAISTDGITWTNHVYKTVTYDTEWGGIAYGLGLFVTSDSNYAWTSPDGKSWTKGGGGFNRGSLVFADGKFVGASGSSIYESDNGTTFTSVFKDSGGNIYQDGSTPPGLSAVGGGLIK